MKFNKTILKKFSPVYFKSLKEHLVVLQNVRDFTCQFQVVNQKINDIVTHSGLSTIDIVEGYSEYLLESNIFRMSVIIYGCICILVQKNKISISEMAGYIEAIKESVGINDQDEIVQYFSKEINVDPSIIPTCVKNIIAKNNEEKNADNLCRGIIRFIRSPEKNESFNDYKSYIEGQSQKIISKLIEKEYMYGYSTDIFTSLLILEKCGFPVPSFYSIDQRLPIPKELMHVFAKKIFHIRYNNIDGSVIDFNDNDD